MYRKRPAYSNASTRNWAAPVSNHSHAFLDSVMLRASRLRGNHPDAGIEVEASLRV
jgi:hypothetical protein